MNSNLYFLKHSGGITFTVGSDLFILRSRCIFLYKSNKNSYFTFAFDIF